MEKICKSDFASPLQPSEHSYVFKLFEKRKVGSLHAYGNVCVAVLRWTCNCGGLAGAPIPTLRNVVRKGGNHRMRQSCHGEN
jgi:hypothetical protein